MTAPNPGGKKPADPSRTPGSNNNRIEIANDFHYRAWRSRTVTGFLCARMSRDTFMDRLRAENIATRAYFSPPLHTDPRFGSTQTEAPVTMDYSSRIVALPFFADLGPENARKIAGLVRDIICTSQG